MNNITQKNAPSESAIFRLPERALLAAFGLALLGMVLDHEIPALDLNVMRLHGYYMAALTTLLLAADREGPWRRRAAFTALGMLATGAAAWTAWRWTGRTPGAKVLGELADNWSFSLWGAGLWMAAPVLTPAADSPYRPVVRASVWALCIYGALSLASAAGSADPRESLRAFQQERGFMFPVLLGWMRVAVRSPRLRGGPAALAVWFLAVLVLAGTAIGLTDLLGSAAVRARLVEWQLVFVENPAAGDSMPSRRLLFPTVHFNRTAYFGMIAIMTFLAARYAPGQNRWRRWLLAMIVPAFFVLIQSYTRGVIVATVASLFLWGLLISRRRVVAGVVLGAIALVAVLPAPQRNYLLTVFRYQTYHPEQGMTSMRARILAWQYGLQVIGRAPLFGLGYGYRTVRGDYRDYAYEIHDPVRIREIEGGYAIQHMHNLWLEVATESGLPAALALAAFCALRWAALARLCLRERGRERKRLAALIALEAGLMIAGMLNYMLRRNYGMLTFAIWTWILTEVDAQAHARTLPASAPPAVPAVENPSNS
ncbi:MAG: O-antigen ligase family protein [bacterium]|nr:O-antigen ligase family protein [bacterium]